MKKIASALSVISLFTLVFASSCSKEGPAGAAGPAGPAGATGATGATGAAGTANVIYSPWMDAKYLPDTVHNGTVVDTVDYSAIISAPKLTSAMLTSGDIRVYFNFNSAASPTVVLIPYFDGGLLITPFYEVGNIELHSNLDLSSATVNNVKVGQVRYLLIPGGVPARSATNFNNYAEVRALYHLPD